MFAGKISIYLSYRDMLIDVLDFSGRKIKLEEDSPVWRFLHAFLPLCYLSRQHVGGVRTRPVPPLGLRLVEGDLCFELMGGIYTF